MLTRTHAKRSLPGLFAALALAATIALFTPGGAPADHKTSHNPGGGGGGGGAPAIAAVKVKYARFATQRFTRSLVVMDADGSNETVILSENGTFLQRGKDLQSPSWSPDAQSLAFSLIDWGGGGASGIWTVGIDGSNLFQVTYLGDDPAWSRGGTEIAYRKDGDIWIVNVDGTNDSNLTDTPEVSEWGPTWSPDAAHIAYSDGAALLVHEIATGLTTDVTSSGPLAGLQLGGASWAKTQDKLVLVAYLPGTSFSNDVWVVDLNDPANPVTVKLTNTPLDEYDWSERSPGWSSNDSQIVFTRGRDLYTMNADGSGETVIAAGGVMSRWSTWYSSPDWKR
jgi:Tol biopolymer transport system component